MKIAIIGGGLTGLTTAYELLKYKNNDVVIYEKEKELGGLAQSFKLGAANLEKFYHHIFKTDNYILDLAEELGLKDKMLWLESSTSIYRDGEVFPFVTAMDLIKFKPLPLIDRVRAGVVTLFLQKYSNWERFKNISAYDWMMKYAGKNVTEVIWQPLLEGKFSKYYKNISMAWLWARINIRANSRKGIGEKEMLGYMDGGYQLLFDELIKRIKDMGGKIFVNSTVSDIQEIQNGKLQMKVNEKAEVFDKVLVTIPSPVFPKLLSQNTKNNSQMKEYLGRLGKIKYLGALCLVFTSEQNLADYYWHNINDTDFPFLVLIHHTKFVDKKNYDNKYVYYIANYLPTDDPLYNMQENELKALWFKYLKKIYPKFEKAKVESTYIFKSQYAQHIVDMNYFSNVPDVVAPIKNLYLSNFSLMYPEDRGMNYAVREGLRMANLIEESKK
jgi:protoporphyrinogen oxidase